MIPFVGPSHPLPLDRADLQRSINLYPVRAEDAGEKTEATLRQVPGLTLWSAEPAPPAPAESIGWASTIRIDGGYAHANTDTTTWELGDLNDSTPAYAGVVGGTAGTVVWDDTWVPVGSDPGPTLTPLAGGVVQVQFPSVGVFFAAPEGLLTLTATVDGVPTDSIEMSLGPANYNTIAWGPV